MSLMDTEEMVRLIVRECGEDLARYLREIHRELAGLREEAHKLRLVNEETKHELSRLNHFRRRILDAVDRVENLVTGQLEHLAKQLARLRVVLDHEHAP
jgi:hypothetical protein